MPPQKRTAAGIGSLENNKFTSLSNWNEEYPEITSSPPRKSRRSLTNNESFFESTDESVCVIVKCTEGNNKKNERS